MSFSEISNRLHAAIFANADADAPRLAFADHLAAVDPEHAELIRLQVQRFATDRTARRRWSQPSKRERELLARHGARWAQDVAPYARAVHHLPAYEFNRGFVERLRTDAGVFARLGEDLLRLGPIRHLALEADGTPLATVLAQPALRHLISLDLEAWKLGDEGAAAIAACPQLSRLVWLGLRHNGIDEPGVEALARAPWVRRLLLLDLRDNPVPGVTLAADQSVIDDDGNHHFEPSELGRRLEAEHGPILWLHPDNTDGADRFHIALVPRPAR